MLESTVSHERGFDPGALALVNGDRASAERVLRSTIQRLDGTDGSQLELTSALIKLGTLKQQAGEHAEAEALVFRALTISESMVDEDQPDLVILFNDLARLSLKQSAYNLAEPLLLRLFAMKRHKGEDHPEVATVLASLAAVRHALGHHESAEQLWRRVLDIRERTLAPNHFALATALEHLADSCAARGRIGEALRLYQRAHSIRELTLGVEHSSLRKSRDRIADLQLQASEDSLDLLDTDAAASAAAVPRLMSPERAGITPAPSAAREKSGLMHLRNTRSVVEREATAQTASPPAQTATPAAHTASPATQIATPAAQTIAPTAAPAAAVETEIRDYSKPQSNAAPYRDILLSIQEELEDTPDGAALGVGLAATLASVTAFLRNRKKEIVVAAGAVAFVLMAMAANSHAWGETQPVAVDDVLPRRESPSVAPASLQEISARPLVATGEPSKIAVAATTTPPPKPTAERSHVADQPTSSKKVSEKNGDKARISIPKLSNGMMVGLDSVARAVGASGQSVGETLSVQPEFSSRTERPTFGDVESEIAPRHARLIGEVPQPRIPDQLSGVEGEVLVNFQVDATGRPVLSTFSVVKSPDPLLTSAVRRVIPGMRFEPARSGGKDSKPITDLVQLGFQFSQPTK